MSPYGLESSYIDFEFEDASESKKRALLSSLENDLSFSQTYHFLRDVFSEELGWAASSAAYREKIHFLSGRQLCAMVVFCANFGLPSIGYHLLIEGKLVPPELARHWCNIFKHVNEFADLKSRSIALNGALVDQDSFISIEANQAQIKCCQSCCDLLRLPGDLCLISGAIDPMRTYAKFI